MGEVPEDFGAPRGPKPGRALFRGDRVFGRLIASPCDEAGDGYVLVEFAPVQPLAAAGHLKLFPLRRRCGENQNFADDSACRT
jgi:hypothetical protein